MPANDLKFEFTHNKKTYHIPRFKDLKSGVLRKSRSAKDDADKMFMILELTLGSDSKEIAALDDMTIDELTEFIKEWTGGAGMGESSGS